MHRLAELTSGLVADLDHLELGKFAAARSAARLKNPVKSAIVAGSRKGETP